MTWSDVPGRLARLAARPGAVFGADAHRWRLDAPLTAAELAAVEAQLRVELPAEYRTFLLQAGRGGAGPAYGLFPLLLADGVWRWDGDGADLTDLDTLATPFPHERAFYLAKQAPDPPDEADFATEEEYEAAEEEYWELHGDDAYAFEPIPGLLYLCHQGCAYREALVVSGPARGQMWADDTAGDGPVRPLLDQAGNRIGFARWYRRWLDGAEA
ncbi:SMI1/KNR4 family protein [Dactylosporangium sp. NBC_01737]|uniref:SMI1/KNR4 family protein n=1 Tax=Dactylosporangium sp. NBC_01737 TaxID=2975959 RepID=UPI002E14129F|nr:SMI1/KNR4 family protein [Dactylosporangium sp. NBC_01737]